MSKANSDMPNTIAVTSRLFSFATAVLVFMLSADVQASRAEGAKVTLTRTSEYGVAFVHVNLAPTGTILPCAVSTTADRAYAVNINTASGRAILNQATTAMALGKSVNVIGRGEYPSLVATGCSVWTGYEDLNLLSVVN